MEMRRIMAFAAMAALVATAAADIVMEDDGTNVVLVTSLSDGSTNPWTQVDLIDAGLGAIAADDGTGITDLGRLALAFRAATGEGGITGTPPVSNIDYRPGGGAGSTVLLDPEKAPAFWDAVRDGTLEPGRYDGDGLVTEKAKSSD